MVCAVTLTVPFIVERVLQFLLIGDLVRKGCEKIKHENLIAQTIFSHFWHRRKCAKNGRKPFSPIFGAQHNNFAIFGWKGTSFYRQLGMQMFQNWYKNEPLLAHWFTTPILVEKVHESPIGSWVHKCAKIGTWMSHWHTDKVHKFL